MKIILTSVGTRGDMEPFLAIGAMLQKRGHEVICAFPEQFRELTEATGLPFRSQGSKFIELLNTEDGKAAMGGASGFRKFMGILRLAFKQGPANKELVIHQREILDREDPDLVIYHTKAIYPILWKIRTGKRTVLVSPVPYLHEYPGHTHLAFNSNWGNFLNKFTYNLANWGIVKTARVAAKWLKLPQKPPSKAIWKILRENPAVYTISPALFPRPESWPEQIKVLGYHQRNITGNWAPEPALLDFLKRFEKVLFITFGSMVNSDNQGKTRSILEVLEKHQIPAILNLAGGGLIQPEGYQNERVHFVHGIPYDWIFPRVYAVVHHGGSGTTQSALKFGLPSLIIPHLIDQFIWDKMVHMQECGPKGLNISKLTASRLEPKLTDLWNQEAYKQNAKKMAQEMQEEDFEEELVAFLLRNQG